MDWILWEELAVAPETLIRAVQVAVRVARANQEKYLVVVEQHAWEWQRQWQSQ